MTVNEWFQNFKRNFCNYGRYEETIVSLQNQANAKQRVYDDLIKVSNHQNDMILSQKGLIEVKDTIIQEQEIQIKGLNPVDGYCREKGYKINNFAYKDKIIINGVKIPCNMMEMITPSSFVVEEARSSIKAIDKTLSGGLFLWYQRIMEYAHNNLIWTSDGRDDNYYYPAYSLTVKRCDCDDYAFAQCSIEPELGTAFGFWDRGDGKPIGHSFAVGVIENELWVFDGVAGNSTKAEGSGYSINYIITQNSIYVVDGSVEFGEILYG